jgi:sodium ion-translocating decarboxylase beta subunit
MYDINISETIVNFLRDTGFSQMTWGQGVMIGIACILLYLAIVKEFEPLLLLPIAFGMMLANLPQAGMMAQPVYETTANGELVLDPNTGAPVVKEIGGLLYYLYQGVKLGIYPPLIFLGIGAMTDFGPLIANPKSLLLGAAAQLGIFSTFIGALFLGFTPSEAASIGIIGGADGPTAIFVTSRLAPELLGPIAVAAYSYMALVPIIQPPIMRAFTTKKERMVVMEQLREVSKTEKILFPIVVTALVALLLPSAAALVGMLMLGNLFRETLVVDRLSKTAQNELINIITIFLGTTVGATASADIFLQPRTIFIIVLGLIAFSFGTLGGVLFGKIMYRTSGGKVNPLIGSAGVSAVPMAARVSQVVGQQENPGNFLLMHAMGPNVAGVIGSAVAAGVFLSLF